MHALSVHRWRASEEREEALARDAPTTQGARGYRAINLVPNHQASVIGRTVNARHQRAAEPAAYGPPRARGGPAEIEEVFEADSLGQLAAQLDIMLGVMLNREVVLTPHNDAEFSRPIEVVFRASSRSDLIAQMEDVRAALREHVELPRLASIFGLSVLRTADGGRSLASSSGWDPL